MRVRVLLTNGSVWRNPVFIALKLMRLFLEPIIDRDSQGDEENKDRDNKTLPRPEGEFRYVQFEPYGAHDFP
jgi:hypothetical protein